MTIDSVENTRLSNSRTELVRGVLRSALIVAAMLVAALSLVVIARYGNGKLAPIDRSTTAIVFCVLVIGVSVARLAAQVSYTDRASNRWVILALSTALVLLAALPVVLLAPGRIDAGLFLIMLVVVEGIWWGLLWPRRQVELPLPTATPAANSSLIGPSSELEGDEEEFEEGVTQSIVRRLRDGQETIEGLLLAQFRPGERRQALHVAFCPPFLADPAIDAADQIDGPDARVTVAEARSYGARFEIHLSQTYDESVEVRIHFTANSHSQSQT